MSLWERAFRPFFLALAVYGALAVPWWVLVWRGDVAAPGWLIPMWWHGHEMVFGLVAAAIAGFLLTAAPVWTGGSALRGGALAALVALWLFARIAFLAPAALPSWLLATIDLSFLPAVAGALLRTLRGSGQHRNYALVGIVLALAAANAAMHAEALGLVSGLAGRALRFAIDLIVVLLLVVGGRITPAFTRNAFAREGLDLPIRSWPWVDALAIGSAVILALLGAFYGRGPASASMAAIAGLATAARLVGWQSLQTLHDPLLWSLHAGSAWVAVGLLLVAASDFGAAVPASAGLHALTAGAMGATILAVITRVGLGHTGRPLVAPRPVVWCYALIHLGAALRVGAAVVARFDLHQALLVLSALAWAGAFGLFALRFGPMLTEPRPDGRAG